MNKVILLVLFVPAMVHGQITENFESGIGPGWIQSPEGHWIAEEANSISGNLSLHHNFDNQESGNDMTGFELQNLHPADNDTKWSFKIRYGCDPSSTNNWVLFLMSDCMPDSTTEAKACNGYVVGLNQTGYDDTLKLWKIRNGKYYDVVRSHLNWQNDIGTSDPVMISAERSPSGQWSLMVYNASDSLMDFSFGSDIELFYPGWLIISYKYTASRDRLLWFDDLIIDGAFYEDTTSSSLTPYLPCAGDVVITEIMADPLPAVSLPGKEYLEIANLSDNSLDLSNWFLTDNRQKYYFPESKAEPGEYIIVCSYVDAGLFKDYGKTIGLKSFPALTDNGKILALCDGSGNLIHGVEYSSGWYGDELKSGGGWSLEIIDPESPFYDENNWQASVSRDGGTPGTPNSVSGRNPDNHFEGIKNVFPVDSLTVTIRLSETVTEFESLEMPVKINDDPVSGLFPDDPLYRGFKVIPGRPLYPGTIFSLIIDPATKDFAGNLIERNEFRFGIPETARRGDILFNELLFNPVYGEPDFIEFYNASSRIIDASRLIIVSVNDETRDTSSSVSVSDEGCCILPGDYYVITKDRKKVTDRFFTCDPTKVFEVSALPSMPDDEGHLVLFNRELEKIDEVFYKEEMQYSLLQQNEGVSLEKVRPESVSSEKSNWHSASESAGWGTPGVINSVYAPEPVINSQLAFSSTRITPDNDGFEDFLMIDMHFPGYGNIVSVYVFDETGNFVKRVADNMLAGPGASVVWDGTDESGRIVPRGIYIILISVFDETGKTGKWKKVCSVIR